MEHRKCVESNPALFQACWRLGGLVGVQDLPAGQRALTGDVLDPAAVGDQPLLGHHVVKVTGVELGEAVLLRDVDLQQEQSSAPSGP